jgi:uncharacterized membrane protein YsdA (DUF1294 family)
MNNIILSRVLVPLLGLVVWVFYYLDARLAYRMPRGPKRAASQLSLVFGSVGVVILQVQLMDRLAPADAHGSYFFGFAVIECGGALVVLFTTLLRERARNMKIAR